MTVPDPRPERAVRAAGLLADFNAAGVLHAGDVHVAVRLGELFGDDDPAVLLAAALAVRAPRMGHVCVDLATAAARVTVDGDADVGGLPWPDRTAWPAAVAASPLAAAPAEPLADRPLVIEGTRVYLRRTHADETAVAAAVSVRARAPVPATSPDGLEEDLDRIFRAHADPLQRAAARTAVTGGITVISGGPGTGKTTTVAAVLALLAAQARSAGAPPPKIAVTAPTGKAAERLGASIAAQSATLSVEPGIRAALGALTGQTLHRLLDRGRSGTADTAPLVDDVVVVDEASMVSLAMMARLVAALRPEARLILVGDAGQLASVEAGAVLGDIVGPAAARPVDSPLGRRITVLRTVHRFGAEIGALADAVREGDADRAVGLLTAGAGPVRWVAPRDATRPDGLVAEAVLAAGTDLWDAAARGDAPGALAAAGRVRVLCAHRQGSGGVGAWTATIQAWLRSRVPGYAPYREWHVGRPVLVTENDYGLGLFNGDSGVVLAAPDGRPEVVFARGSEVVRVSPARLGAAETVHAMTIHKSQGSQFATAVVIVPDRASRLLTRELLYTGITRARRQLIVVGEERAIRDAIARPIARATGLRDRLWG